MLVFISFVKVDLPVAMLPVRPIIRIFYIFKQRIYEIIEGDNTAIKGFIYPNIKFEIRYYGDNKTNYMDYNWCDKT